MNKDKSKVLIGIISILLWAVIIIVTVQLYMEKTGGSIPIFRITLFICVIVFLIWWIYSGTRLKRFMKRFMKRFDEAGFQYLVTQNTEEYIKELDKCSKMPGIENFALSGMPAKEYIAILKIINLRTSGKVEEANTLLEMIGENITNERARQLWKAEKKRLQ